MQNMFIFSIFIKFKLNNVGKQLYYQKEILVTLYLHFYFIHWKRNFGKRALYIWLTSIH